MANYVSLDNLKLYDTKIKGVISAGDSAVQANVDAEVTRAKAAEVANANAAKKAQDDVDALTTVVATKAAQADLDALSGKVGTVPTDKTVMGIIGEIQANAYDDTAVRGLITALENNKADKTQVATDIETAVNAEKTARETAVTGVQNAVDAEKTRAEGIESGLRTDVDAIKNDYLKGADKTALEGKITTAQNTADAAKSSIDAFLKDADATANAVDTLKEIQAELDAGETSAASMLAEINALKAVDNATQAEMDAAIATVNTEIAKKADTTVVTGIDGRVTTLEGKFGTGAGTVSAMISDAISTEATRVNGELAKKIETVKVNGVALTMDADKSVDVTVPTDNKDLANGAGYLVANDIANKADKATTLAGYGVADAYTKTETDNKITAAISAIQPIDDAAINALFN